LLFDFSPTFFGSTRFQYILEHLKCIFTLNFTFFTSFATTDTFRWVFAVTDNLAIRAFNFDLHIYIFHLELFMQGFLLFLLRNCITKRGFLFILIWFLKLECCLSAIKLLRLSFFKWFLKSCPDFFNFWIMDLKNSKELIFIRNRWKR
jgi:hypothetical protein